MADKTVGSLELASGINDASNFVCEDSGVAKRVTGEQIKEFAKSNVSEYVESAKASAESAEKAKTAAEAAADRAEAATVNTPKVQNGNWWVYNKSTGAYEDSGVSAYYIPVRGTDYWTAEDQAAIVSDVLAALPDGTEVSY